MPRFTSGPCHLLAMRPEAGQAVSLNLSLLHPSHVDEIHLFMRVALDNEWRMA